MSDGLPEIKEFDRFRLVSKIGEGGMGTVYLAEDKELGRRVAIKFLSGEFGSDAEKVNRFIQEAKAASALNHPNILTIFEIGQHDNTRYIVSEYIEGSTLRDLGREHRQTLDKKLEIALQIASALSAAHQAGIIHRDIKPENIMIRRDGLLKVLDFGLAKLSVGAPEPDLQVESQLSTKRQIDTAPGLLLGTVAYMSPEQARGKKLDPRSDIFSFGVVLFELFTDRRPFDGESQADLISAILKDDVPSVKGVSPNLPRELDRIIGKTLRKDREHRYQTVKDLCIDLEDLRDELKFDARASQTGDTDEVGEPAAPTTEATRPAFTTAFTSTPRFTLLHAAIIALTAIALVASIWLYFGNRPGDASAAASYKAVDVANWSSGPGELSSSASFSPDDKLITFSSTRSGSKNIWVMQTASADSIQITNDANGNVGPIFSPDSAEIAYIAEAQDDPRVAGGNRLFRISALGGTPRLIGQTVGRPGELRRWLPDGRICYQSGANLFAMDLATGVSQQITSFQEPANAIPWIDLSNDEKSVAYLRVHGETWTMNIGDGAGGFSKVVAEGSGQTRHMVWLRDRGRIFFSSKVDGVFQVFVQDFGSIGRRITTSETDVFPASASSDGTSVLTTTTREQSNIWVAGAKDGKETPIAAGLDAKLWPSVSHDNQRVAFVSAKNLSGTSLLSHAILVKSLAGGEGERPTTVAQNAFIPMFSPDGANIAFMRQREGIADLYVASASSGQERRLAENVQLVGYTITPYNLTHANAFAWAPDGAAIVYPSKKNGAGNLWLTTLASGDTQLTEHADPTASVSSPLWSLDGSRIAYFTERKNPSNPAEKLRAIKVFDVRSRATSDILETTSNIRPIGWDADSRRIIVAETPRMDGASHDVSLRSVDAVPGGTVQDIATLASAYYFNIAVSPDGRNIAFAARANGRDDLWTVPFSGGTPKKLTANSDSTVYYSRLAWLCDGSAIVYGKQVRFTLLSRITDIK